MLRKRYNILLRPLAYIYGLGVSLRNTLFDWGVLKETTYPIPIICVGNITVGGTGKTPHVEYVLDLLTPFYRVAVLSRGYKRKSRGLIDANISHTAEEIGDEPKQIKLKYPEVRLIINSDRRQSMEYLMGLPSEERPQVVVMDDGLQHRYVKPSYRVMLMDITRPVDEDRLLPEGSLRESISSLYRMDCIVVTKCPEDLNPMERRGIERSLSPYPYQHIAFSSIAYLEVRKIENLIDTNNRSKNEVNKLVLGTPVLLLSGIANSDLLKTQIRQTYNLIHHLSYPDHHSFSIKDIEHINKKYEELILLYPELCVICTEKDAVRLIDYIDHLSFNILHKIYYLPIKTKFIHNKELFDHLIFEVVKDKS